MTRRRASAPPHAAPPHAAPPAKSHTALSIALLCAALFCAALLLTDCGGRDAPRATSGGIPPVNMTSAREGQRLFRSRSFGSVPVACADCHAETDDSLAAGERLRPGHSILGASRRLSTWNGAFSGAALETTAAGAARCALRFMGRRGGESAVLTAAEASALMDFFEAISTGDEARTLPWTAFAGLPDTAQTHALLDEEALRLSRVRGDARRGAERFTPACASCHPADRGDAARGDAARGDAARGDAARGDAARDAADRGAVAVGPGLRALARRAERLHGVLRLGSGAMPFFATDKLSAQDVADLAEFLAAAAR